LKILSWRPQGAGVRVFVTLCLVMSGNGVIHRGHKLIQGESLTVPFISYRFGSVISVPEMTLSTRVFLLTF
jgi:hypothetical protein